MRRKTNEPGKNPLADSTPVGSIVNGDSSVSWIHTRAPGRLSLEISHGLILFGARSTCRVELDVEQLGALIAGLSRARDALAPTPTEDA